MNKKYLQVIFVFSICFTSESNIISRINNNHSELNNSEVILPIKYWQKLSYSTDILNCQYEPSCSNFMNKAILKHGYPWGIVVGADRIVRCNPLTHHYYNRVNSRMTDDGRIVDELQIGSNTSPYRNPKVATVLSIIPGFGRVYAGNWEHGLFSFITVIGSAMLTYNSYKNEDYYKFKIYFILSSLFWVSDFYGAYRSSFQYE